jgi:hypothetical protein
VLHADYIHCDFKEFSKGRKGLVSETRTFAILALLMVELKILNLSILCIHSNADE